MYSTDYCSRNLHDINFTHQADNDFISTHGIALGVPFDAGLDNDNQMLVFRVTLPGAVPGDIVARKRKGL